MMAVGEALHMTAGLGSDMDEKRGRTDERRLESWIGSLILVKGDVVSSGDLVIDGRVEGTIELGDHSLTIGSDASVIADLVARTVTISGTVKGNVTGAARVELRATGTVDGDITTPAFVMQEGATLRGRVDTGPRRPTTPPAR
jgi:cytoskeletal protein CcmA (bactofilin family)